MMYVKCKKEIPEGAVFCPWCGKKQIAEQKKTRRRAHGMGTIRKDSRYASPWIAIAPPVIKGTNGRYVGAFKTRREAEQALEAYLNEKRPDLYNATLDKIYAKQTKAALFCAEIADYAVITQSVMQIVLCSNSIFVYVYKLV